MGKVKAEKNDSPEKSENSKGKKTLDNFFTKKTKKVAASSDESGSDIDEISISLSPVEKREKPARARKEVKYHGSDVESNSNNSGSDSDETSKRSRKKKKQDDTFDSQDIEEIDLDKEEVYKSKPKKAKQTDESEKSAPEKKSIMKSVFKPKENIAEPKK